MFRIGLIIGLTLLVYGKSLGNSFVRWDDSMLIYENPIVREISWKSLKAAFTQYDPELYIPLTFLSYQLDYVIGGMHPFMFHLTNLILHTLNAVLVYALISLLFRRFQISENKSQEDRNFQFSIFNFQFVPLFVALVWAVHPLNTEAVAWASGRKDVLSTFFFLCTIILYLRSRDQNDSSYFLLLTSYFSFLLGLLAKVSIITLPLVLLLMEYFFRPHAQTRSSRKFSIFNFQFSISVLPYFLLSVILGIVGLFGKQSALGASTLGEKFLMAPKSAVFYLEKLFWPQGFSVLYPYTGAVTIRSADFAVPLILFLLLIGLAIWTWFRWRRASIGLWFFLVTVTPTFLNFAKGGDMDRYFASDRYAYIPSIGIFLAVGYWLWTKGNPLTLTLSQWERELQQKTPSPRGRGAGVRGVTVFTICILLILSFLSHRQSLLWGNTELLLQNVLRLYGDSSHVAHNNMGNAYRLRGDLPRALEEYKKALAIRPHSKTLSNLGATYRRLHRYPEAVSAYRKALELNPKNPEVQVGLGLVSLELGKLSDARKAFTEAIANDPRSEEAYVNLGAVAMREGKTDEAIAHYRKALEANPYFTQAHYNLAVALSAEKRLEEATGEYEAAIRLDPSLLAARINLGILYYNTGRRADARTQFHAVLEQDPGNATAREALRQMGEQLQE